MSRQSTYFLAKTVYRLNEYAASKTLVFFDVFLSKPYGEGNREKEIEYRQIMCKGLKLRRLVLKRLVLKSLERKGMTHELDSLIPFLNKKELLKISSSKSRDLKFNHKV